MTDAERLRAVVHENNRLRKENERLRSVEDENARLRSEVVEKARDAGNAWQHAMMWKGRDDARGKDYPAKLAEEWNAALEAAAVALEEKAKKCVPFRAWTEEQTYNDAARVARALKREAK